MTLLEFPVFERFKKPVFLAPLFLAFGLGACGQTGSSYRPIVDGPLGYAYENDLGQCQQLAEQRKLFNGETKAAALAGAAVLGAVGAADADDNKAAGAAIAGALVGGAFGAGAGAVKAQGERKDIVINCMRGRGHKVVG